MTQDDNLTSVAEHMARGWRYTRRPFPSVDNDFALPVRRELHLWMDWLDHDYESAEAPRVCASMFAPGDVGMEADRDEVLAVPVAEFLIEGALYALGGHKNHEGTLTFASPRDLKAFNDKAERLARELEAVAREIRRHQVSARDLTDPKSWEAWRHG